MIPIPAFEGPEPLIVLLMALALDAALGGWRPVDRLRALPLAPVRAWLRATDRRLNRIQRPEPTRRARGALVTLAVATGGLAMGWAIGIGARSLPYGWVAELWILLGAIGLRRPWNGARAVADALSARDGTAAREALATLSPKAPWTLDDHGVVRAGVEALATALHRRLVAPVFWYAVAGLPGLLLWQALEAMDAAVGAQSARHQGFGAVAARTFDALDWVPARLSAVMASAGAPFVGTAMPWPALRTAFREGGKPVGGGSGWPVAAFAGALALSLGGPRREGEVLVRLPWIGDGRARAETMDLRRALMLFVAAGLVTGALVGSLALGLGWVQGW
jgi:adenosylcobinamide-phosphate synthase